MLCIYIETIFSCSLVKLFCKPNISGKHNKIIADNGIQFIKSPTLFSSDLYRRPFDLSVTFVVVKTRANNNCEGSGDKFSHPV